MLSCLLAPVGSGLFAGPALQLHTVSQVRSQLTRGLAGQADAATAGAGALRV